MFSQACGKKTPNPIKVDIECLQEPGMLRRGSRSVSSPWRMTQHAGLPQQLGVAWNHLPTASAKHFNMTQTLSRSYKKYTKLFYFHILTGSRASPTEFVGLFFSQGGTEGKDTPHISSKPWTNSNASRSVLVSVEQRLRLPLSIHMPSKQQFCSLS